MKPTYRRSWAGNLLMFSDLTLGPFFKVKQWFTGFGELSFRWIQICIGSPMRRSSLKQETLMHGVQQGRQEKMSLGCIKETIRFWKLVLCHLKFEIN